MRHTRGLFYLLINSACLVKQFNSLSFATIERCSKLLYSPPDWSVIEPVIFQTRVICVIHFQRVSHVSLRHSLLSTNSTESLTKRHSMSFREYQRLYLTHNNKSSTIGP